MVHVRRKERRKDSGNEPSLSDQLSCREAKCRSADCREHGPSWLLHSAETHRLQGSTAPPAVSSFQAESKVVRYCTLRYTRSADSRPLAVTLHCGIVVVKQRRGSTLKIDQVTQQLSVEVR